MSDKKEDKYKVAGDALAKLAITARDILDKAGISHFYIRDQDQKVVLIEVVEEKEVEKRGLTPEKKTLH